MFTISLSLRERSLKLSSTSSSLSANGSTKFSGVSHDDSREQRRRTGEVAPVWYRENSGTPHPPRLCCSLLPKLIRPTRSDFSNGSASFLHRKRSLQIGLRVQRGGNAGGAKSRGVGAEKSKLSVDRCCCCCCCCCPFSVGFLVHRSR